MSAQATPAPLQAKAFADAVTAWQKREGRQHLPWQYTGDAYKVWLSEIMLQQTQVSTVLNYYARFLDAFPTVADLAAAPSEAVMTLWAGLGYYSRARNLHACAKAVVAQFGGQFPRDVEALASLPGIGRSTAGAVASLAHGVQAPILDGNVKRVFCRYYGIEGDPMSTPVVKRLWEIAQHNVPAVEPGRYNQALMDLGATRCTPRNARCGQCPLMSTCVALRQGRVEQLPSPKLKKPRPELHFVAIWLVDARGCVWLQQQTERGLWKDLWMPPCIPVPVNSDSGSWYELVRALVQSTGLQVNADALRTALNSAAAQPWLVHELTHRKMHFKTVLLRHDGVLDLCKAADALPLPKVVHKLTEAAVAQQNTLDVGQGLALK
ncbi:A/G-specific adenine glycosylase [Limnobacter humi]|uniref:Adenine DNA glycosylase n=1 Tax=Limnobacter humi TaxID=1778671 RepID=A0ABT1WIV7_9BURK|nr:A/G-specific adenine glycosylase [Limnobacter humi]MCQ8897433.1 A/G-specific adenine glycosylase [Limnobacter humi]